MCKALGFIPQPHKRNRRKGEGGGKEEKEKEEGPGRGEGRNGKEEEWRRGRREEGGMGRRVGRERRKKVINNHPQSPTRSFFPSRSLPVFELDQEDSDFSPPPARASWALVLKGLPSFPVVVKLLPDTSSIIVSLWLCSFEPATHPGLSKHFLTGSEQF